MTFSFSPFRKVTDSYYFGLFLKENTGVGCILQKRNNKIVILAKESFTYSNGWEHLAEDVDDILSKLENSTKCHVENTIFFFFSHIIDQKENSIKRPYATKIKDLTKGLGLKPIGYIECNDAVSSFISEKDTFPLTSILIEIDETNLGIFVYKSGSKKLHTITARTDSIVDDMISVFQSSEGKILLPSRIIIYNSSDLTEYSERIISHRWEGDLFVQPPRVEILEQESLLQALVRIFESQVCTEENKKSSSVGEKDVSEVMGFMIGRDIGDEPEKDEPSDTIKQQFQLSERIKKTLVKIKEGIFVSKVSTFPLRLSPAVFIFFGIVFLLFSLIAIEVLFHKARLTFLLQTKKIEKVFSIAGSDGKQESKLRVYTATSSARVSETAFVTGKRDIGEKARGEVTVHNFDDKERIIAKGTVIRSDSREYVTNNEIKIASATLAGDASAKLPGKNKVAITASVLGSEYNLEKNKRFTVGDFSSTLVFAINESGITGGTKNSVTTVSKKDLDDLEAALVKKAKALPLDVKLKEKESSIDILESLTAVELRNVTSSKEVGEEGNQVELKAVAERIYFYIEKNDLKSIIRQLAQSAVPSGYSVSSDGINYEFKKYTRDLGQYDFSIFTTVTALKTIDTKSVPKLVAGQSRSNAVLSLKNKVPVSGVTIDIQPNILFLRERLPFLQKNITITVENP